MSITVVATEETVENLTVTRRKNVLSYKCLKYEDMIDTNNITEKKLYEERVAPC